MELVLEDAGEEAAQAAVLQSVPSRVADLMRIELSPFDPESDGARLATPVRPAMQDGGLLGRARRRRGFEEAMRRYSRDLAELEQQELERGLPSLVGTATAAW